MGKLACGNLFCNAERATLYFWVWTWVCLLCDTDRHDKARAHCRATKCSPTQNAPFSSILCTLHTQYAPLEHFVYPVYTICYQRSILCRVGTYVISMVVRGYTICSSWKHVSWYVCLFFLTVLSTSICLSYEPCVQSHARIIIVL